MRCCIYKCEIASTTYLPLYCTSSPSCFRACVHDRRRINQPAGAGGPCWSHNWHLMPAVRPFSPPPPAGPPLTSYYSPPTTDLITNCMVSSIVCGLPVWRTTSMRAWPLLLDDVDLRHQLTLWGWLPPLPAACVDLHVLLLAIPSAARSGSRHPEDGAGGLELSLEYIYR